MARYIATEKAASKVLMLDCSREIGIRRLKKSLMKLPFIKNEKQTNTDNLEKLIQRIELKHQVTIGYISRSIIETDGERQHNYSAMIKETNEHHWVTTAYGLTMWEVYAKSLFYLYYYIDSQRSK